MLYGIWLALLGVLAASNLIIAKKPDAAQLIGKIAPYQGWIGAVSAVWGAFGILRCVRHIGLLSLVPGYWLLWLANSILLACLGLLLGVGVFKSFIKSEGANVKLDRLIARLAPYQGKLGVVAIVLGAVMVIGALISAPL
ncbi:MAG TPA: hypothetical protein VFH68_09755 [Polyangia bacterium]|jgi:hypothetical protein|nr:hypothetical protein [Polyangia bacterium]